VKFPAGRICFDVPVTVLRYEWQGHRLSSQDQLMKLLRFFIQQACDDGVAMIFIEVTPCESCLSRGDITLFGYPTSRN
jgi:hypothetical protein